MSKRRIILSIVICIAIFGINARELLHFKGVEASTVGIYIEDLKTGKVIASQNANKAMTPASVTKSITSAASMLILEKDFQFKTHIYAIGDTIINDGILNCNIVVNASGDPTIESQYFPENRGFIQQLTESLLTKGVKSINGIIISEDGIRIDDVTSSWMLEDIAWDYGAELKVFNYKDNCFEIYIPTATDTISIFPQIPKLKVFNQLILGEENDVSLSRPQMSHDLVVSGTIKPTISNYRIGCSMPNPSDVFISDFKSQLALSGISITDNLSTEKNDTMLIYCHKSPKRDEILRSLMVRSDNLFAEAMMQALNPMGGAIDSVISKFEHIGIDCSKISLYDGCGLSRVDRLSPIFIADVYRYMYNSNIISDYVALFPKAGHDGTLKNFLSNTRLKGQFALKTGSMGGVQCYGGYKLNEKGEPTHIVVIMVNNFFCKRNELRKDIERLLLQIF